MKKLFLFAVAAMMLTSCVTTTKTARTGNAPYQMYNATVADLDVAPNRITYTLTPSAAIRRGGPENCKQAALNEALTANGNADLLVEPQYVISSTKYLLRRKITSVTVTGRPAKYKNFRSLKDDVWTNPNFVGNDVEPATAPVKKGGFLSKLTFWK